MELLGDLATPTTPRHLNVIDARWVLRWKRGPDGKRVIKARLTVRGFKDLQAAEVSTFAGTTTRWGQRLVCSLVANHGWDLFSADVGAAFLKGLTFKKLAELTGERERTVAFTPPSGSEHLFRSVPDLKNVDFRMHVLRMLRPGFGLKDSHYDLNVAIDKVIICLL